VTMVMTYDLARDEQDGSVAALPSNSPPTHVRCTRVGFLTAVRVDGEFNVRCKGYIQNIKDGWLIQGEDGYMFGCESAEFAGLFVAAAAITASAGSNGTISPTGIVSVDEGDDKTFTIAPATHYHVATVLVDGQSVGAVTSYEFDDVSTAHTIAATFAIDTNAITASVGANGTIEPAGAQPVNYGANKTFTVTPALHYAVDTVLVDGQAAVLTDGAYTFTNVIATHTIAVTFVGE